MLFLGSVLRAEPTNLRRDAALRRLGRLGRVLARRASGWWATPRKRHPGATRAPRHPLSSTEPSVPFTPRLCRYLLDAGLVDAQELAEAQALRDRCRIRLEEALVTTGCISEDALWAAVAKVAGMEFADLRTISPDPAVARRVPFELAHRSGVLPLYDDGVCVVVAANHLPARAERLDGAGPFAERKTRIVIAAPSAFDETLDRLHGTELVQHAQSDLLLRLPAESARAVPDARQQRFLAGLAAVTVLAVAVAPSATLAVIISLCTAMHVAFAAFRCWIVWRAVNRAPDEERTQPNEDISPSDASPADADLPVYTILIPVYREAEVLPVLLEAVDRLDYPKAKLDVKILLEEDDPETMRALRAIAVPSYCRVLVVPNGKPKGKPKACNYGLLQARGEYIVIYDAEDIPDPDQLRKALHAFRRGGDRLGCVQAKLNYFNRDQNLLTRWFTSEYSMWFDLLLPGLDTAGVPIPLGGTSNHLRVDALRDVGAWDPYNVTEDADLGMRLHKVGWRTTVIESTTYEEANSQLYNWIRQRSRWVKGYIQTYLVHMRHPLRLAKAVGPRAFVGFQLMIGGTVLALLLNPVFWVIGGAWLLTRHGFLGVELPHGIVSVGMAGFFVGNFVFLYLSIAGCVGRGYFACVKYALLSPVYWGLMSVAAWKGLLQLFYAPSYWEKTQHGLARRAPRGLTLRAQRRAAQAEMARAA